MGKHEAPSKGLTHSRKSEHSGQSSGLANALPELKLPKVQLPSVALPKVRLPKVKKPELSRLRHRLLKLARREMKDEGQKEAAQKHSYDFSLRNVGLVGISSLLFFLVWLVPTHGAVRTLSYLLPCIPVAVDTFRDLMAELIDREYLGRNLLTVLAAVIAYAVGEYPSAFFILMMFRVLILVEAYAREQAQEDELGLREIRPRTAKKETANGVTECDPAGVAVGETLLVEPGEVIPLDGIIVDGITSVDASPLTGSAAPMNVSIGSSVYSGCINRTNTIRMRVTDDFTSSAACRIQRITEKAAATKPRSAQPLRYAARLLPAVFAVLAFLFAVILPIFNGQWKLGFYKAALLLAISSGSSLLYALALLWSCAIRRAARRGILVKSADIMEELAEAETMVFSKTGTISEGRYVLEGVFPEKYTEKELVSIAALAECQSQHPIAEALREASGVSMEKRDDIHLVEEIPGRGVSSLFSGRNVYVGNAALLMEHGISFAVPSRSGTVIHVAVDNEYAGYIVMTDRVRDGAFDAIEELRIRGVKSTVMLTGDVRSVARPIASSLNFDLVKCELPPEAKISAVEYLQASKGTRAPLAYVSGKEKELPILERADVGILLHTLGSKRGMDGADVAILDGSLSRLPLAKISAKTSENRAWLDLYGVLGLKALLLIFGLTGVFSIWISVFLDTLIGAAALVNAVRR